MTRIHHAIVAIVAFFVLGAFSAEAQSLRAAKNNLCVDVAGGKMQAGTPIILWPCHGRAPQLFLIDTASGQVSPAVAQHLCVDDVRGQGLALFDCIKSASSWVYDRARQEIRGTNGLCWDVPKGQFNPRQRMKLWKCNSLPPQRFAYR